MKLTAVRMTKRGRVALYGDDEFLLSMHPDVFAASGLSVGSEVDGERLAGLAAEAELKKAKERAFSMLSGREYTSSQLRDRLARHVDPEAAGQAVERMEELGLVDDDGYAERYARELSERKHCGLLRIRQELRQKGLSGTQIEQALESVYAPDEDGESPELEAAAALVQSRYMKKLADGRRDLVAAAQTVVLVIA